jgi:hypothetical protein
MPIVSEQPQATERRTNWPKGVGIVVGVLLGLVLFVLVAPGAIPGGVQMGPYYVWASTTELPATLPRAGILNGDGRWHLWLPANTNRRVYVWNLIGPP